MRIGRTIVDVTIAVVNWNTLDLLRQCLHSIDNSVPGILSEVVVVDNGSSDGSADCVAREFPGVRVIRNEQNLGFARANNQAIRCSTGRYILLLNSDAILLDRAVERMVRYLDDHPQVGAAGGKVLNLDGSFQSSYADFPDLVDELLLLTGLSRWLLPSSYPFHAESSSGEEQEADWLSGACLMLRRRTLDEVGLLDEQYFMYAEEMDLCFRIKQAGWAIRFTPQATAHHWAGGSYRRSPVARRTQIYRSKLRFMRKYRGQRRAFAYALLVPFVSALKMLFWATELLSRDSMKRERSKQAVRSYVHLLANF